MSSNRFNHDDGYVFYVVMLKGQDNNASPDLTRTDGHIYFGREEAEAMVRDDQYHVVRMVAYSDELDGLIKFIEQQGVEFARHRQFLAALSMVILVPGFNIQSFKSMVKQHPKMMKRRTKRHEYLEQIEYLYNYHQKTSRNHLNIKNAAISQAKKKKGA